MQKKIETDIEINRNRYRDKQKQIQREIEKDIEIDRNRYRDK